MASGEGESADLMKPILLSAAGNPENQDRGLILETAVGMVLCVADGAGGRSGAREAAELAIEFVREHAETLTTAEACSELLMKMDRAAERDSVAGETTCVIAVVTANEIFGASVGDSSAWLMPGDGVHVDLTQGQQRKPVIGSGSAWPNPFKCPRQSGRLLPATDGLLKYTSAERIVETCWNSQADEAARQLIELVRYPSGALPDDVTVILAEVQAA